MGCGGLGLVRYGLSGRRGMYEEDYRGRKHALLLLLP